MNREIEELTYKHNRLQEERKTVNGETRNLINTIKSLKHEIKKKQVKKLGYAIFSLGASPDQLGSKKKPKLDLQKINKKPEQEEFQEDKLAQEDQLDEIKE